MKRSFFILALILALSSTMVFGQRKDLDVALPPSWTTENLRSIEKTENITPLPIDTIIEFNISAKKEGMALAGYLNRVDFNLDNSGQWDTLKDGSKIWRLALYCSAYISRIHFDKCWFPEHAKLYIYSFDKEYLSDEVMSSENHSQATKNNPIRTFSRELKKDSIVLEYYIPSGIKDKGIISIWFIEEPFKRIYNKKNTSVKTENEIGFNESKGCNININCPLGQDWQIEKKAIARVYIPNYETSTASLGTGFLINNIKNDFTPYFITANHCLNGYDAINNPIINDCEILWNYEYSSCENETNAPFFMTTEGSKVIANNINTDFALLQLTDNLINKLNSEAYYLGWDIGTNNASTGITIHHPMGDVKKITTFSNTITLEDVSYNNIIFSVLSLNYNEGITEHGSSGSPLINYNRRVIGVDFGIPTANNELSCEQLVNAKSYFINLNESWNNANDEKRKLQPWLDPGNIGATICDGTKYYPCLEGKGPFLANRTITVNTTITNPTYASGNVIIKKGATLTLKSTLYMPPDLSLYVEKGAKLIIDGGKITSACTDTVFDLFNGIIVMGDNDNVQTDTIQGVIQLTNAIIENSWNGVNIEGGAIIQATNTQFSNNIFHEVEFENYANNNLSSFSHCTFKWEDCLTNEYIDDIELIKLNRVKGITFNDCTFFSDFDRQTHGILADSAGFTISGTSKFMNLYYGIRSMSPKYNLLNIEKTEFTDNKYGIYVSGSSAGTAIIDNTFNINVPGTDIAPFLPLDTVQNQAIGVYIEESHNFVIRNNDFIGNSKLRLSAGVQVKNLGGENNDTIKNNNFQNLYSGTQIVGTNHKQINSGLLPTYKGVVYDCNNFEDNLLGMYIANGGVSETGNLKLGVVPQYGSRLVPLNNSFSDILDILNNTTNNVTYFYNPNYTNVTYNGNITLKEISKTGKSCGTIGGSSANVNTDMLQMITDNISTNTDINEILSEENLTAIDIIEAYISDKNYTLAKVLLDKLSTKEYAQQEIENFKEYISYLEKYGRLYDFPEDLLLKLASNITRIGLYARNMLYFKKIKTDYHPQVLIADISDVEKALEPMKNAKIFTDRQDNNIVVIFPNPTSSDITVTYNLDEEGLYQFIVFDINGTELTKETLQGNNGEQSIRLNKLSTGTYFYKVIHGNKIYKIDKLIIM